VKYLDVFVDESGDLGFSKNATNYFIVAFLICDSSTSLKFKMKRTLKRLHQKNKYPQPMDELKFTKMDDYCKKYVLKEIAKSDSYIGVIVVEKEKIVKRLRDDVSTLYNWLVVHNIMLSLIPLLETTPKMNIYFDKSLPKKRINSFNTYLEEKASYLFYTRGIDLDCCISSFHANSRTKPCLQAVDSVVGAYFQLYERKKPEYVDIIKGKERFFIYRW
jgi:hypothetical protein